MKYISIALSLLLIFCLISCNNDDRTNGDITTDSYSEDHSSELLEVRAMGYDLEINQEQSDAIKKILEDLEWQKDITKTAYDYILIDGELMVRYSYNDGVFNDVTNKKHVILSDERKAEVNAIVDKLIVLPTID